MTASELIKLYSDAGFDMGAIRVRDAEYSLPSRDWIFGEFGGSFETLKANLGRNNYVPEINDCDDFSLLMRWYIKHLHFLTSGKTKRTGIASGSMMFTRDDGECHEINTAVTEGKRIVFFEPQNSKELSLSKYEVFSCSDVSI